ncbi:MAG: hypothetical protein A2Y73_02550 [Chloroflexi bacterium RBG_13_56_8]|nr:MAG: hypothetical protein A2Y73_02550 [Chloroflexi bacterium RBG_13_56_8]
MVFPYFTGVLFRLPVTLAYVVAIILCVIFVVRRRDWPSSLALLGFSLLLVMNVLFSLNPLFQLWLEQRGDAASNVNMVLGAAMLMESAVAALAVVCLVIAIWLGPRRT